MTTPFTKKVGKSTRGVPQNEYGELKKRFSVRITDTGKSNFKENAAALDMPLSELLDRLARSPSILIQSLALMEPDDPKLVLIQSLAQMEPDDPRYAEIVALLT